MPTSKPLPARADLIKVLSYDPETGLLLWLPRENRHFRNAGKPALNYVNSDGYKIGTFSGFGVLKAHRVAWKIMTGEDPLFIDHINGERSDNRWGNLRNVTIAQNSRNLGLSSSNTSGFNGVYWYKPYSKWMASISINGRRKNLGYFAQKEDAIAARMAADAANGYTFRQQGGGVVE